MPYFDPDWTRFLLPELTTRPLGAYHVILLDLAVLIASCMIQSVIAPAWSLPSSAIPIYAVLVILLAYTGGVYRKWERKQGRNCPRWQRRRRSLWLWFWSRDGMTFRLRRRSPRWESAWAALWRDAK